MTAIASLLILLSCVYYAYGSPRYDKPPVSSTATSAFSKLYKNKLLLGTLTASGLFVIKKGIIDGPMFAESVDLSNYNCVITGGNTGLGKETAIKLASLGANTIILCKSPNKAVAAVEDIKKQSGSNKVSWLELDLGSLKSIDECSKNLKRELSSIDILVNNAGVMAIPTREETIDGFEKQLGINHLGHFALTSHLLPLLQTKNPFNPTLASRIVSIASTAHLLGNFKDHDNLLFTKPGTYQAWPAYGNSKLANIHFTRELSRKLASMPSSAAKRDIIPLVCHPGGCRTELGRYIVDPEQLSLPAKILFAGLAVPLWYATKDSRTGAQTQIYLSASSKISPADSGKYFDNSQVADTSPEAKDQEEASWLWKQSEKLTSATFPSLV